jgi:hypothetical protein
MAFCSNCGASVDGRFCPQCGTSQEAAAVPPAQSQPTAPPVPSATPPPAKKGISGWVWALIGCFGLVVIAGIAISVGGWFVANTIKGNPAAVAARILAATNPDVEVVSVDGEGGRITLRDKKTGKQVTLDLDDIKKGRISFEGEGGEKMEIKTQGEGEQGSIEITGKDGTAKIGKNAAVLPDWVPSYPGAETVHSMQMNTPDAKGGTINCKTGDSPEKVAEFYESALKGAGMEVSKNSTQSGDFKLLQVGGEDKGNNRTINVTVSVTEQGTMIGYIFTEK